MHARRLTSFWPDLVASLKTRISGRPRRDDALSLLANQHRLNPIVARNVETFPLLGGALQGIGSSGASATTDIVTEWVCPPVLLCRVRRALINLSTGIIYDPEARKYLLETCWGWAKYTTASVRLHNRRVHRIPSGAPVYVFAGVGYHGIVEDLSAILLLREQGHQFKVLVDGRNEWMLGLLALFLPASVEVIRAPAGSWIEAADDLLIVTKSAFGEFVHPRLLDALRRAARPLQGASPLRPRLFISRADTRNRAHGAEERLAAPFVERGFDLVRLSALNVREQVLAFQHATDVAGLHGAGFANLVWSQGPVQVDELYSPQYFNSCYACLAHTLGHPYASHRLTADPSADAAALTAALHGRNGAARTLTRGSPLLDQPAHVR